MLQIDINQMTQTWGVEIGKVELYVLLAWLHCIFICYICICTGVLFIYGIL